MLNTQLITYAYLILAFIYVSALKYEDEHDSDYGDTWLMYQDEEGTSHIMNFSTIPNDTRGLLFGDAYYYLYTRFNSEPEELQIPESDDEIFTSQYFNASNLMKVATHGWLGSGQLSWLQKLKDELLIKDDFNVIIVDWHSLAQNFIYPWSAFSTRYVGKKTAKLIDAMVKAYDIDSTTIHLLGHSLGAQVMAYAGMFSNHTIGRITGLDPARPLFELPMMPKDNRLDKTDAKFVDIIHTCAGLYGYAQSHGHADFYPNQGRPPQPGCTGSLQMITACSHGRAFKFFIESINSETRFHAYPCESWTQFESGECSGGNFTYMGFYAKQGDSGDYYLYTNSDSPFAKGDSRNT